MHATCLTHLILLDLITLIIFLESTNYEEHESIQVLLGSQKNSQAEEPPLVGCPQQIIIFTATIHIWRSIPA
jgi:hypothetical protein